MKVSLTYEVFISCVVNMGPVVRVYSSCVVEPLGHQRAISKVILLLIILLVSWLLMRCEVMLSEDDGKRLELGTIQLSLGRRPRMSAPRV